MGYILGGGPSEVGSGFVGGGGLRCTLVSIFCVIDCNYPTY